MNHSIVILYTTVDTIDNALMLAKIALENRVAACINIIPHGQSMYLWNDTIEQSSEYYILFRTTVEKISSLKMLITDNHPYDIPAILTFYAESSEKFFDYLHRSVIN